MWLGPRDRQGYGLLRQGGRRLMAHRVSYQAHRGPIPPGHEVGHLCGERACVRPDHLEARPRPERAAERRGGNCKLDPARVREIRRLYAKPGHLSQRRLGHQFGVSKSQVGRITRNEKWKGV